MAARRFAASGSGGKLAAVSLARAARLASSPLGAVAATPRSASRERNVGMKLNNARLPLATSTLIQGVRADASILSTVLLPLAPLEAAIEMLF